MNDFQKEVLLWVLTIVIASIALIFTSRYSGNSEITVDSSKTGPLYTGKINTDLNLDDVFDKSLVSSELILTNATEIRPPPPIPPSQPGEKSLIKYFRQLYPNMNQQTFETMKNFYSKLDCWYETLMPQFGAVANINYTIDRLQSLTAIDNNQNLVWTRLFDGNLCDCLRISLPECKYSANRLTPAEITDCPEYPGLRINQQLSRLLQIAYDSDNPGKNAIPDVIKHQGMSGLKGFPDGAWYEGLTFPGEYGVPILCTASRPVYYTQFQKGLTYNNNGKSGELQILNSNEPWFSNKECSTTFPACPTGFECVNVTSDGSYGPKDTKDLCLRTGAFVEKFNQQYGNVIEGLAATDLKDDCDPPFPQAVCSTVKAENYRGYYTYPLRGCGLWFTVGKSIVCNTKLGFLIAPEKDGGMGIDLTDLMQLRGTTNAPEQNINSQVGRLSNIIQYGSVSAKASPKWPAMTIADLQKHGYSGTQQASSGAAYQEALKLVSYWYINGYTGIENGITNGANYSYEKYFPIGTHFAYASRFDNLIVSSLAYRQLDSIQLLLEPQNVVVGLRPAYMFEILSNKPTTELGKTTSAYPDISIRQCKAVYSINPSLDLNHYIRFGYIDGSKVTNPPVLDSTTMIMRAEKPSFIPETQ